jgi:hypothetical protein
MRGFAMLPEHVEFRREPFDAIADELPMIFREHYNEIAHFKDIQLSPDYEKYSKMDAAGGMRIFTARSKVDGQLIGYAFFFVHPNIHYKSSKQAVQDLLFISKEKRGFGRAFIAWCDERLKEERCEVVYHHVKAKHNFGPLLEKLGYELVDLIYARRV